MLSFQVLHLVLSQLHPLLAGLDHDPCLLSPLLHDEPGIGPLQDVVGGQKVLPPFQICTGTVISRHILSPPPAP